MSGTHPQSLTHARLAQIVARSYAPVRRGRYARPQMMPSDRAGAGVNERVSAFDLARRFRRAKLEYNEHEIRVALDELVALGVVAKGPGGYAVVDWDALATIGGGS